MNSIRKTWMIAVLMAGAAVATGVGAAQDGGLSAADRLFVTKAAQAGHAEIAAGKLASAKGTTDDVRKFAAQMVEDHTAAANELRDVAQRKGLTLPAEADAAHLAYEARLDAAATSAFDRLYITEAGVKDHRAAVDLFTEEAANGSDPDLKAFAAKTLPTIKHHYDMAQSLSSKIR